MRTGSLIYAENMELAIWPKNNHFVFNSVENFLPCHMNIGKEREACQPVRSKGFFSPDINPSLIIFSRRHATLHLTVSVRR